MQRPCSKMDHNAVKELKEGGSAWSTESLGAVVGAGETGRVKQSQVENFGSYKCNGKAPKQRLIEKCDRNQICILKIP